MIGHFTVFHIVLSTLFLVHSGPYPLTLVRCSMIICFLTTNECISTFPFFFNFLDNNFFSYSYYYYYCMWFNWILKLKLFSMIYTLIFSTDICINFDYIDKIRANSIAPLCQSDCLCHRRSSLRVMIKAMIITHDVLQQYHNTIYTFLELTQFESSL